MDRTGPARRLWIAGWVFVAVWIMFTEPLLQAQESKIPAPPLAKSESADGPSVKEAKAKVESAAAESRVLEPTSDNPKATVDRGSITQLIVRANPMLWLLVACSIISMGYALERLVALRKERVVPSEFVGRFLERLSSGKLDRDRAIELCKAHDSPVARIFGHVCRAWGQPGLAIRQIVAYDSAGELIELKRNLRMLSAMATIGPLLGLLGTVIGIIQSFDALGGRVGPAKGEALAHGISLALVATAIGLVIALFSVAMYYHLLNRVDRLARDLDEAAKQVIELVSYESLQPASIPERTQV